VIVATARSAAATCPAGSDAPALAAVLAAGDTLAEAVPGSEFGPALTAGATVVAGEPPHAASTSAQSVAAAAEAFAMHPPGPRAVGTVSLPHVRSPAPPS
jgi:hypothetical protein